MTQRTILSGLAPVASQRMVLANSTALGINGTVRNAKPNILIFSVETNNVRQKSSAAPTLTTGVLYSSTRGPYYYEGYNSNTSTFRFQRTTGTAVVNIEAYRQAKA